MSSSFVVGALFFVGAFAWINFVVGSFMNVGCRRRWLFCRCRLCRDSVLLTSGVGALSDSAAYAQDQAQAPCGVLLNRSVSDVGSVSM